MRNGFRIIDSDAHVYEPLTLYDEYLPPDLRERLPEIIRPRGGGTWTGNVISIEDIEFEGRAPFDLYPPDRWEHASRMASTYMEYCKFDERFADGAASDFDAASTLRAMDREGIDVSLFHPSGLALYINSPNFDGVDPGLTGAFCTAYNNWLADFCKEDPQRLKGVAVIPMREIEIAVTEAHRVVTELGMVAVVLRPDPCEGRRLDDPYNEPLYTEVEGLGVPLHIHHGTGGGGADRRFYGNHTMMKICSHPVEQMMACEALIVGGVLERHPKLRVAFLEAGCGWIVYWLVRMGELLENFGTHEAPDLRAEPMEYFRNQCFIATEEEEGEDVAHVIARMGANKVLWGSDYPHPDSAFPRSVESFFDLRGIAEEDKRKILWDNPAGLYSIGP